MDALPKKFKEEFHEIHFQELVPWKITWDVSKNLANKLLQEPFH